MQRITLCLSAAIFGLPRCAMLLIIRHYKKSCATLHFCIDSNSLVVRLSGMERTDMNSATQTETYRAAMLADDAFQVELERQFGGHDKAIEARYAHFARGFGGRKIPFDAATQAAYEAKRAADDALFAAKRTQASWCRGIARLHPRMVQGFRGAGKERGAHL
ncbi:MAG TPA: hypothetical protein VFC26_03345 [Verrucomicrobiae bacterium]|nr:hypothetical protein [Verrucomicrobiae bacterium]